MVMLEFFIGWIVGCIPILMIRYIILRKPLSYPLATMGAVITLLIYTTLDYYVGLPLSPITLKVVIPAVAATSFLILSDYPEPKSRG